MTGSLLRAGGNLLDVATSATGESFRRPDGLVVSRSPVFTQDGHDVYDVYEPASITDGSYKAPGDTLILDEDDLPASYVSARVISLDIGRDDDFTIDLCWRVPNLASAIHQVNPAVAIDLERTGTVEDPCGFVFAWDVSLFATYWHRLPKGPTPYECCIDHTYFVPSWPGTGQAFLGFGEGPDVTDGVRYDGDNWIRVRCKDGMLEAWWHGLPRHDPVARPTWMDGRTRIGLHIVSLQRDPSWASYPPSFPPVPLEESMPQITHWSWSEA